MTALTSYAGRRNAEAGHSLTAESLRSNPAVMADISFPGGVILGFSDGSVRWVTATELGLPADQAIVVGDASAVESLRHLSDR